jgi:hypothetical protein
MFTADAELEAGPHLAAARRRDLHELADAVAVDRHERVDRQDALGGVGAEKARRGLTRAITIELLSTHRTSTYLSFAPIVYYPSLNLFSTGKRSGLESPFIKQTIGTRRGAGGLSPRPDRI